MTVRVDRLVLDIPGLSPQQARQLGEAVGAALAEMRERAAIAQVSLTIDHPADIASIAARIAQAVRAQIG